MGCVGGNPKPKTSKLPDKNTDKNVNNTNSNPNPLQQNPEVNQVQNQADNRGIPSNNQSGIPAQNNPNQNQSSGIKDDPSSGYKQKNISNIEESGIKQSGQQLKQSAGDPVQNVANAGNQIYQSDHSRISLQKDTTSPLRDSVDPTLAGMNGASKKNDSHIQKKRPSPVHVTNQWNNNRQSYEQDVHDESIIDYGQSTVQEANKIQVSFNM